jgi:hypothetical protein
MWRNSAVALFVILTAGVSRADVSDAPKKASKTPIVIGLTIAVDETTRSVDRTTLRKLKWFPIRVTFYNRSDKPFKIATYGAFRKMPFARNALGYGLPIPYEKFGIDFKLIKIQDKDRIVVDLIRPSDPSPKYRVSGIQPDMETLFPGEPYALHTTINFAAWKPVNSNALVNGFYDLQANWTGTAVQDGKNMDATGSSNILRIEIGD